MGKRSSLKKSARKARTPAQGRPSTTGSRRRDKRPGSRAVLLALIVIGAFAVRLIYLLELADSPFFLPLSEGTDENSYYLWARAIARGDWLGQDLGVFTSPPLYAYLLGGLFTMVGENLYAARVVQFGIGAVICLLVFLIAEQTFNRRVGFSAALLAALYGTAIFFEGTLSGTGLATLCLLGAVWLLRVDWRSERLRLGLAGLATGAAALARPNLLLLAPAFAAWLLVAPGSRRAGWRSRLRRGWSGTLAFIAGVALAVAPVTLRNYLVSGEAVLLTAHGGINFYIGNNPLADGLYTMPPGLQGGSQLGFLKSARELAEQAVGQPLTSSGVSAYWFKRSFRFILEQPLAFVRLTARKLYLFWNAYEIPLENHIDFQRRYATLLRLPLPSFGLIAPFGLVGLVLSLRRRQGGLPGLALLVSMLSVVAFYITARYRLQTIPFIIIFAAYAAVALWEYGRRRDWRLFSRMVVGLGIGVVVVHLPYGIEPGRFNFAMSYYNLGNIQRARGHVNAAIGAYQQALAIDPNLTSAHYNSGLLYNEQGRYAEAVAAFRAVLASEPESAEVYNNLGAAYTQQDRLDEAEHALQRAIELDSTFVKAYVNLGGVRLKRGDHDAALAAYRQALALSPAYPRALAGLGTAYALRGLRNGSPDELRTAQRTLERSLVLDPNQPVVQSLRRRVSDILAKVERNRWESER